MPPAASRKPAIISVWRESGPTRKHAVQPMLPVRRCWLDAEQARRDAEIAKAEAEAARAALDDAVRRSRRQAEQAACEKAEALAEEALARRRSELAEIERRAKAAEEKAQRHLEAEQRLTAEIQQHQAFLARAGSAEREAPDQIDAADALMAALSDAMIALHGFEHAPVPPAARRWATAQQMSAQMADAIARLLRPAVDAPANGSQP